MLSRELVASLHYSRDAWVGDADLDVAAALALEDEADGCASDLDVPTAERGQAERPVLLRVLLVADAHERGLQKLDDGCHDLLSGQTLAAQVAGDSSANAWQNPSEAEHPSELVLVAHLAPARVVAVLLASSRIAAGRLQVAARTRGDPDVLPRRRDGERPDAVERVGVAHHPTLGIGVDESLALARAPYPRLDV
jgi:hypothetical protein